MVQNIKKFLKENQFKVSEEDREFWSKWLDLDSNAKIYLIGLCSYCGARNKSMIRTNETDDEWTFKSIDMAASGLIVKALNTNGNVSVTKSCKNCKTPSISIG